MLRFHLLRTGVGRLAHEMLFIAAFAPRFRDLRANGPRRGESDPSANTIRPWKRLREGSTVRETSRAFWYTRSSLKLLA